MHEIFMDNPIAKLELFLGRLKEIERNLLFNFFTDMGPPYQRVIKQTRRPIPLYFSRKNVVERIRSSLKYYVRNAAYKPLSLHQVLLIKH